MKNTKLEIIRIYEDVITTSGDVCSLLNTEHIKVTGDPTYVPFPYPHNTYLTESYTFTPTKSKDLNTITKDDAFERSTAVNKGVWYHKTLDGYVKCSGQDHNAFVSQFDD